MIGEILNDRYKIQAEIGQGGMAIVYEGQDLLLDRKVAVKILRPEHMTDESFVEKFKHEAKAVARISHPHVVSIFDIGRDNKYHYLVMEIIEGQNLKDIISNRGQLSITEALDIAHQICSALEVAHSKNIIHCDIKPHNVILDNDKTVKVTDFGIARAVNASTLDITDTVEGSAHYLSPEQAQGEEVDAQSDMYSVGVVLYEMLTGDVPFKGDSPVAVALKHIQKDPPSLSDYRDDIPRKVENFVIKALAKNSSDRFESASVMKEKLIELKKTLSISDSESEAKQDTKIMRKSEILKNHLNNSADESEGIDSEKNENNKISAEETKNDEEILEALKKNNIDDNTDNNKDDKPGNSNKKNKKGKYRFLIIFGIIFFVIFASLGILYNFYMRYTDVPTVEVPELTGFTLEQAENRAAQRGLDLNVESEVSHEEVEEGIIISQEPQAGSIIRQTRVIQLTLSQGPPVIEMPEVVNLSFREAQINLENSGISVTEENINFVYSDEYAENYVMDQTPEPGREINIGEDYELTVSAGPHPDMVEIPDITGLNRIEASFQLREYGLQIGNISTETSRRYLAGQIMRQQPAPGREVPHDSEIDITVSQGLLNAEEADIHSQRVMITVTGFEEQEVVIEVEDINGVDIAYRGQHRPGDNIEKTINSVGPTTYRVYMNDDLIHEEDIE